MMRLAAFLIAALLWGQAALAAPVFNANLGTIATGTVASPQYLSTTVDSPAGSTTFLGWYANATSLVYTITDSAGNTCTSPSSVVFNTTNKILHSSCNVTTDLPGPCTVTATETATTFVVSGVGTCSSTDTFTVGQQISGTGFTGTISVNCPLTAGAGTCTITGGSTVSTGATATVSSAIKFAYTGGSGVTNGAAANFSGLVTSSPRDVTGPGTSVSTVTTLSVATGTLCQASELIIGTTGIAGSFSAFNNNSPFTVLTAPTGGNMGWGYDIVSATTSVTYAPSWTTARNAGANVYSYKAAGGTCVVTSNGHLLSSVGAGS